MEGVVMGIDLAAELTQQLHVKAVIENDALTGLRMLEQREKNAGWLGRKLHRSAVPNKNRSGHGPEHREAFIENASRSLATEIDKALNA